MEANISLDPRLLAKLGYKTAVLISKLHSNGNYDGNFIGITEEFIDTLGISMFQFRKVRDFCKVLNLVEIKRAGRPNRTNLSLNLERYNEILTSENMDYGIKP